ncbi:MAG TPA: response regulator [Thermoanaerobaculaceae bacterium]|nr:response regulator [Thermoanaerobaculaceae bacterium]
MHAFTRSAALDSADADADERPLVWVVDDDASVRTALARLLRTTALAVETFGSGRELLERLAEARPRCLVLDLALPELTGLELFHLLHERGEPIPVVFVSGEGGVGSSVQAMKEGAIDFLEKPVDADALLSAVVRALAREAEWRQTRNQIDQASGLLASLTPREREVLFHVASGKSNKRIATELGTSEKTIKVHRGRVMHKLGAGSVVDLVHLTERAGVLA